MDEGRPDRVEGSRGLRSTELQDHIGLQEELFLGYRCISTGRSILSWE
jgi:hypothetical protein